MFQQNIADDELIKKKEQLDEFESPPLSPDKYFKHLDDEFEARKKLYTTNKLNESKKQLADTNALMDKCYKDTSDYYIQQTNSDKPSFGIRSPSKRFGFMSSYAKRHSVKQYLQKHPEDQDCIRRKMIYVSRPSSNGRSKSAGKLSDNSRPGKEDPSRPKSTGRNQTPNSMVSPRSYSIDNEHGLSFKTEDMQQRLSRIKEVTSHKKFNKREEIVQLYDDRDAAMKRNENYLQNVRGILLKKQADHAFLKQYIDKIVAESDITTIRFLLKDEKVCNAPYCYLFCYITYYCYCSCVQSWLKHWVKWCS